MTEQVTKADLDSLHNRIAELEAVRAEPVKVEIEGLDGLKRWSQAVEAKDLDNFYLNHSVPDRSFWGLFWVIFGGGVLFASVSVALYW